MNIMKEYRRINIAFRPSLLVEEYCIKLSKKFFKPNEKLFVLDGHNFFPHITIYSPDFPNKNVEKVVEYVERLSFNFQKQIIEFSTPRIHNGFVGISIKNNPSIQQIHENIVMTLGPLRQEHLRLDYSEKFTDMHLSESNLDSLEKYGYMNSMELYDPHITITRTSDSNLAQGSKNKIEWPFDEMIIEKIGIFEMGENGTCTKAIQEIDLV